MPGDTSADSFAYAGTGFPGNPAYNRAVQMKRKTTNRGFAIYEFTDSIGEDCSLQKSSSIEDKIWLGATNLKVQYFIPNVGWKDVELPPDNIGNNRMHLTRKQVEQMLPILQKFVETGDI